ncbi:MAG: hypothetical protein D6689_08085 [Deltaproteobacteria bacterium]|nr:MAG: hypothetical protein D6689_08085 [Deltaproteobacteria bacterium]
MGRAAAWIALVCAVAAPRAATAQESDVPQVRFALALAGRGNLGEFGSRFDRGWLWGVEAGWQPGRLGVAWAIQWSVPQWAAVPLGGSFSTGDPAIVDEIVSIMEMSLGPRIRWPLSDRVPHFALLAGGATLMRTSIPIPPDARRSYLGPYAALGYEQLLAGRYMVGVEVRYEMIGVGPSSIGARLSLAFGSR